MNSKTQTSATRLMAYAFSGIAWATLFFMLMMFAWQSIAVWKHEGLNYLIDHIWFYRGEKFGALSMIFGTLVVATIALLIATPLGLGAAIFSSEYLPPKIRHIVKVWIELLAGVPSVVYGLLGILLLRNWVYDLLSPFDPLSGDTLLTGGILLGIMILPTVMTFSDDALRGIPSDQRLAGRGLGLTKAESIFSIILPQARRGIIAAILLSLGRALGETIAIFLVIGRQDGQPLAWRSLLEAGQTLSSKLGGSEINIAYGDPLHWAALTGLGLVLLVIVGLITLLGATLTESRKHHA